MNIRKFFTKKRVIWSSVVLVVLLLIVGASIKKKLSPPKNVLTDVVKKQDLKQTVLATGQVTSTTDLNLSFKGTGVVNRVSVKVGDKVSNGQILANLEQRDQAAALTSARGALAAAQANYEKVLAGASSEEVQLAQVAVDNAKKNLDDVTRQQQVAVANAYSTLLNSSLAAVAGPSNTSGATVIVSGAYTGTQPGTYNIRILPSGSNSTMVVTGLESVTGTIRAGVAIPLGTKGLYVTFSTDRIYDNDTWTIELPNMKASTYVANQVAYNAALQTQITAVNTAQSSYDAAVAQLNLKRAQVRPADIKAAQAQILSAQGQYQAASASFENTVIRAPANGTITLVDIKPGELPTAAGKPAIVLQDVGSLHVEANISEANIAKVKVGQEVDITLDSFSSDRHFKGTVVAIDPASTTVSGVINYKVTASLEKVDEVKPGMTANMTIITAQKSGVLSVPSRSVIGRDGKSFVRIITDLKKKKYSETEVTTGLEADGGVIEIVSGLNENQTFVTEIKNK